MAVNSPVFVVLFPPTSEARPQNIQSKIDLSAILPTGIPITVHWNNPSAGIDGTFQRTIGSDTQTRKVAAGESNEGQISLKDGDACIYTNTSESKFPYDPPIVLTFSWKG